MLPMMLSMKLLMMQSMMMMVVGLLFCVSFRGSKARPHVGKEGRRVV